MALFIAIVPTQLSAQASTTIAATGTIGVYAIVCDGPCPVTPTTTPPVLTASFGPTPQPVFTLTGRTFPTSTVTLLENGRILATTTPLSNGLFQFSVQNTSSRIAHYGLQAEDSSGVRTRVLNTTVSLGNYLETFLDVGYLPSTMQTSHENIRPNELLVMSGKAAPLSYVEIFEHYSSSTVMTVGSGKNGAWATSLNASLLGAGVKKFSAVLKYKGSTAVSHPVVVVVGERSKRSSLQSCAQLPDLNNDCKISLADFSILSFWLSKRSFPGEVDINEDGKIDLRDFSILAYYWTGK